MKPELNPRDARLIEMWRGPYSTQEICAELELTRQRVHQILKKHRIPRRKKSISPASRRIQTLFDQAGKEILAALCAGIPSTRVAALVDEPYQGLLAEAHARGLPKDYSDVPEADVDAWARMYKTSSTLEISRLVGAPVTTVYACLERRGVLRSGSETMKLLRTRKGPPKVPRRLVSRKAAKDAALAKLLKKLSKIK